MCLSGRVCSKMSGPPWPIVITINREGKADMLTHFLRYVFFGAMFFFIYANEVDNHRFWQVVLFVFTYFQLCGAAVRLIDISMSFYGDILAAVLFGIIAWYSIDIFPMIDWENNLVKAALIVAVALVSLINMVLMVKIFDQIQIRDKADNTARQTGKEALLPTIRSMVNRSGEYHFSVEDGALLVALVARFVEDMEKPLDPEVVEELTTLRFYINKSGVLESNNRTFKGAAYCVLSMTAYALEDNLDNANRFVRRAHRHVKAHVVWGTMAKRQKNRGKT